ncbi:MAG TPA: BrnT family toxin [Roseiarcus sp.]|jgi:hypothetical protein
MSKFDWDDSNREKCTRRVPVHDIEALIDDWRTLIAGDPYEGETRFRAIGRSSEGLPLFVVFTMREKNGELYVRPISTRYRHRGEGDEETVPEIR